MEARRLCMGRAGGKQAGLEAASRPRRGVMGSGRVGGTRERVDFGDIFFPVSLSWN